MAITLSLPRSDPELGECSYLRGMARRSARDRTARRRAAMSGAVASLFAFGLLWAARAGAGRAVYVSELGADGEVTAGWFRLALLLIVSASISIAWAARREASDVGVRPPTRVSVALTVSGVLFFLASQVPCTSGCPLPTSVDMVQDAVHTASAVLAFAAAVLAMVLSALDAQACVTRWFSAGCGFGVAIVAATGGVLSLLRLATDVGGTLEFIATSIGLLWLIALGINVSWNNSERDTQHSFAHPG